ncbi:MAG: glycosyltransferase family 1 protein [Pseudomonadota bacterium]
MIGFNADLTVLDISRLWARRDRPSPSGIDRLELQTAEHGLKHNTLFFVASGPRRFFLSKHEVCLLTEYLRDKWTRGPINQGSLIDRLARVIGLAEAHTVLSADHPAGSPTVNLPDHGRINAWHRLRRGERYIGAYANGSVQYMNVSHQHLEKLDALQALKDRWRARFTIYWHDAIPLTFPEYAAPQEPKRHRLRLMTALTLADELLVNSEATKEELLALAAREGAAVPPIDVRPLVPEFPGPEHTTVIATAKPYFVTIGTIEPRKNHLLLLQIWREMADALGEACPALVIIGMRGWLNEGTFAMLDHCRAIKPYVIEAAGLSDRHVATLLKGANALLFPSFAEGFGLPLLEAQQMGTPVIASDLPVFREIAVSPFRSLSPLDGKAWKDAVLEAAKLSSSW